MFLELVEVSFIENVGWLGLEGLLVRKIKKVCIFHHGALINLKAILFFSLKIEDTLI